MPKKFEHEEIGQPVLFYSMSDRVAVMMAVIEAKQREVERIVAEEAKKNIIPPLIEALEEEIEDSIKTKRINDAYTRAHTPVDTGRKKVPGEEARQSASHCHQMATKYPEDAPAHLRQAEHYEVVAAYEERHAEMNDKTKSRAPCLLLRAQLDAAKKDAEWKIQSFKIIDALTKRVAALEARLEAKETVPLGTPVLGSDPDSGEDSCEGAEEPVRRTLFPYW